MRNREVRHAYVTGAKLENAPEGGLTAAFLPLFPNIPSLHSHNSRSVTNWHCKLNCESIFSC